MPEEREFRIGELGQLAEPARARPGAAVDAGVFPTLAAWLGLPSPKRRERADALAERARQETRPAVQAALQAALRLLSELQIKDGGGR
jgi:hypothetical protein